MRKKILFVIPLLLGIVWMAVSLHGAIPESEREALIAFYNATNGDNWKKNTGWKEGELEFDGFSAPGTENLWHGITVLDGHVIKIELRSNRMEGILPAELGDLEYLQELHLLHSNKTTLTGNIPPELGRLSNLVKLRLRYIGFSGRIPAELGNLENLEELTIYCIHDFDRLEPERRASGLKSFRLASIAIGHEGPIPAELGNLTNLKRLHLSGKFEGSIPVHLTKLVNLEELYISGNITGNIPPELGGLKNLNTLILNGNLLEGSIPAELGGLAKMQKLHLRKNRLSGEIPPVLGDLPALTDLNLSWNRLSGAIPPELGNLGKLQYLELMNNRLSGTIPAELGNLKSLLQFQVQSNMLSGSIPINLSSLSTYLIEIGYNSLYTKNAMLKKFLRKMQLKWAESQTISPLKVTAVYTSESSVKLSWTPIPYRAESGSYLVYSSESSAGPWMLAGKTANKSADSFEVTQLKPGKNYFFVLRTETGSHKRNANIVTSGYSRAVSAKKQ
ncbi:MAG: hypothetical protein GY757_06485 [bacterium]|nr:hypothetical protein [bacterium]